MKRKIALLTQWFDPEPTFKGLLFAKGLLKEGFEVTVITGYPNYPSGNLYPGYKIKLFKKEIIHGVNVIRLPLYPSHSRSIVGRIFNYLSFGFSSIIYTIFFMPKVDVLYGYHPPLTIGIALSFMSIFRKIPIVYDIQDIWPDSLKATGMFSSNIGLSLIDRLCNWVYSNANIITVLSPGFKEKLINKGVEENKIHIIYNWCNEELIIKKRYVKPESFKTIEQKIILFAGNLGPAQSLKKIILAFKSVETKFFHLVIIGTGIEQKNLKDLKNRESLSNVTFLPPVSMKEIGDYLNYADLLLVHLKNDPLFEITIPSKIQAYLAIGKPLLVGVRGDTTKLIKKSNSGITFEPDSTKDFLRALREYKNLNKKTINKLSYNSKLFYKNNMAFNIGVKKFSKLFNDLL